MSFALKYFALGCATIIASQSACNASAIGRTVQKPTQIQYGHYNYTYTPGIGAHRVHSGKATWNMARRSCVEQGGYLAIINSAAEAQAVVRLLNESDAPSGWVGVHDYYQEGEFVTIHGDSLGDTGFDEWKSGEPNNAGGDENCVLLFNSAKLFDIGCTSYQYFICELQQGPRLPETTPVPKPENLVVV